MRVLMVGTFDTIGWDLHSGLVDRVGVGNVLWVNAITKLPGPERIAEGIVMSTGGKVRIQMDGYFDCALLGDLALGGITELEFMDALANEGVNAGAVRSTEGGNAALEASGAITSRLEGEVMSNLDAILNKLS